MGQPVLIAERVSKVYPGVVPVPALTDVSLRVFAGDILAIEGPSGSGKSTLLGLLGLLDVPTEGQVYIDGVEAASRGEIGRTLMRRDTLGFVFQQFHLVEHLNAQENVEMALLFRGLSMTRRRSIASAMLERVGLENRLDHAPRQLSGGEQQRVALARALVSEPKVVLADEPTGNLDSVATDGIMDLLDDASLAGVAIVVVTHDGRVAARAHTRVHLRDGRTEPGA